MPLFFQQNINESAKIGIWKIEEEESFFLQQVAASRDITHPHKRLQHLASRYLLSVLFNDFPVNEIQIANSRKPFLEKELYQFSISHCGDYAAAIVSKDKKVGIDIELITSKIERIKDKFLSDREKQATDTLQLTTLCWAAKEAVYKWYGKGEVNFKEHIQLLPGFSVFFSKEGPVLLQVQTEIFTDLVLAYVIF